MSVLTDHRWKVLEDWLRQYGLRRGFLSGIYRIRNILNGKVYIGSALDLRRRSQAHFGALCRNVHHSQKLQRAWNKYGDSAFVFEIIELAAKTDLTALETEYILRCDAVKNGYNNCSSGKHALGIKRSPEMKEKLRRFLGRKYSVETLLKMSLAQKGRKHSEAVKRQIGEKARGRQRSPESRAKTRQWWQSPEGEELSCGNHESHDPRRRKSHDPRLRRLFVRMLERLDILIVDVNVLKKPRKNYDNLGVRLGSPVLND